MSFISIIVVVAVVVVVVEEEEAWVILMVRKCSVSRRDYYGSWCYPFLVYGGLKKRIKSWRAAPSCIFWAIWKETNMRYFNSEESSNQNLKSLILSNFSMWVRVYIGGDYMHLIDFIEWLRIG